MMTLHSVDENGTKRVSVCDAVGYYLMAAQSKVAKRKAMMGVRRKRMEDERCWGFVGRHVW